MNNFLLFLILGSISLIIFKDYFDIFFEQKQFKWNTLFWIVCLIIVSALGCKFSLPLIGLFLNTAFAFLVMCLKYKGRLKRKLFLALLSTTLWLFVELLVMYLFNIFRISGNTIDIQGSIMSKLIMLVIVKVLAKLIVPHTSHDLPLSSFLLLLSVPLTSLFINLTIFELTSTGVHNSFKTLLSLLSSLLLIILNIIIFRIYDSLITEHKVRKQNILYEQQISSFKTQIEQAQEESLYTKRLQHDLNTILFGIRELAKIEECNEIIDSINYLMNDKKIERQQLSHSGNPILDNFLNSKLSLSNQYSIKCTLQITIPLQLSFELSDLLIILSNGLDNAIENTCKLPASKRQLDFSLLYKNSCLHIGIKNSFNGIIKHRQGSYITTKVNTKNHGMGLGIINKVVDKYDGELHIEHDNNYFYLIAVLCEPK